MFTSPQRMSQLVADRAHAARAAGGHTRSWRIECGPRFFTHLRKIARLHEVPGWQSDDRSDGHGWLLWGIPVRRVPGPEGWRLLEAPPR